MTRDDIITLIREAIDDNADCRDLSSVRFANLYQAAEIAFETIERLYPAIAHFKIFKDRADD